MLKVAVIATAGAIVGIVVFWTVTISATVPAAELPTYTPDVENGSRIFNIGGCASCHASPNTDASMVDRTRLGGGLALKSPFGTFYVPNISPDPEDGIGSGVRPISSRLSGREPRRVATTCSRRFRTPPTGS